MLPDSWKKKVERLDFAFQPIVSIKNGKIFAVEALLRNIDKIGYYSSIFAFFDDAFNNGVLYQLDLELRKMAIKKFANIKIENIRLFYNLDNRLVYVPDFSYGNTTRIINFYNIKKEQICFELSERDSVKDHNSLTNMIARYKKEGFDIAIDDFGTGIAGFKLLYYAETDYLKIDRFFIDGINRDRKKKLFCKSIIDLAHIMNIKVIAEGIETKEEYYTCKEIEVDFIQGYYIQKPKIDIDKIKYIYEDIKKLYENDNRNNNTNFINKDYIEYIEPLNIESNLYDLFKYFKNFPNNHFAPIVDSLNQLIGIIDERDIKFLSYSPYGASLAQKSMKKESLLRYIKDVITAESSWGIDRILDKFHTNEFKSIGIFITSGGRYKGFIDLNSLLELSYKRNLEIASDQNPLTKLNGNISIEKYLQKVFADKENYFIVYFDFDNFKPFNDYYGFRRGDRAILLFANILKTKLNNSFIAHIGGDDFFAGFKSDNFEDIYEKISYIQQLFYDEAKSLYDKKDKEKGFIKIKDRFGIVRDFSFLSVSCLVIQIYETSNIDNFNNAIGKLKKYSKLYKKPLSVGLL